MKRLLLVLSLIINVTILYWISKTVLALLVYEPPVAPIAPQSQPIQEPMAETASSNTTAALQPVAFHWSQVESTNYVVYIDNLRLIGCPETVIRRIITGDLNELYTQRRQKILEPWQHQIWDQASEAVRSPLKWYEKMKPVQEELEKTMRKLDEEKAQVVQSLLGDPSKPNGSTTPSIATPFTAPPYLTDYLTEEKQRQVIDIEKKYNQMTAEVRRKNRGKPESEIMAQIEQIKGQRMQEMQAMLSPAEYEEYRLRTSSAASIRWQAYGFEATQDEWRSLVKTRMEMEEQLSASSIVDPKAKADAKKQMQNQLEAQYKSMLGADRYAIFEMAQQEDYRSILRVTERCDLPQQTAAEAYQIKRTAESAAKQVIENKNLTQDQLGNALENIRTETEKALSQTLGDRAYKTYTRYSGDWLNKIKR